MADTLHVVEIGQVLVGRELTRHIQNTRAFSINCRHIVIRNQHDLLRIPHTDPEFIEYRLNPTGATGIVDHRQINRACHYFAGRDRVTTGSMSDDLLGERGLQDGNFPAACIAARQPNTTAGPSVVPGPG